MPLGENTMEKTSDCWETPQWLFDELNREFNFDIDLCAKEENSKCKLFYSDYLNNKIYDLADRCTIEMFDGSSFPLKENYNIQAAFMNPPYSNSKPFIEKAWEDSKHCKIVCLVKCDPSTKWWATFWDYGSEECYKCEGNCPSSESSEMIRNTFWCTKCENTGKRIAGPKPGCEVRYFPKRIQFDPPKELIDSGEVWKERNKWVQKCECVERLHKDFSLRLRVYEQGLKCTTCKGKGYKPLSGPTFPSALVIMDRR